MKLEQQVMSWWVGLDRVAFTEQRLIREAVQFAGPVSEHRSLITGTRGEATKSQRARRDGWRRDQ